MTTTPKLPNLLQTHYTHLMQHRRGETNDHLLATMYASALCGQGAMPLHLGLPLDIFRTMMEYHFPTLPQLPLPAHVVSLDFSRLPELDDLRTLATTTPKPAFTDGRLDDRNRLRRMHGQRSPLARPRIVVAQRLIHPHAR